MGWMGFTIACWRRKPINTRFANTISNRVLPRYWRSTVFAFILLILSPSNAVGVGIEYGTGNLNIALSDNVEQAINNGVELTFICEFAMISQFLFVKWPEQLKSHHFIVKHHALSNSYLVSDETDKTPKIFRSTTDTMNHIASEALKLFASYQSSDTPYQMRFRLSKYDLPAPMRLNAFVSSDWDLNTGWNKWQSAR